jgi:hypothetical protein
MSIRGWILILVLEILAVIAVMSLFQFVDKQISGLLGGFIFSLLGVFIGFRLLRAQVFYKSATFWWLFVYMFYSVLPLLLARLTNWGVAFDELKIWGISGPDFHLVARNIYLVLIAATLIDLFVAIFRWLRKRGQSVKN